MMHLKADYFPEFYSSFMRTICNLYSTGYTNLFALAFGTDHVIKTNTLTYICDVNYSLQSQLLTNQNQEQNSTVLYVEDWKLCALTLPSDAVLMR